MKKLFEVKESDLKFYEDRIKSFLPEKIVDIHTHVYKEKLLAGKKGTSSRTVSWPSMVARENPIEDLIETYNLMFPGKQVTPMFFSTTPIQSEFDALNNYVSQCAQKHDMPALIFSSPAWSAEELEKKVLDGGFLGIKSYLTAAPSYLPTKEIRIFDFFPHHQLKVMDKRGLIVMLHIPRDGRLKDPVNLAQMLEIEEKYPNLKLIIAHVGRAYCDEDVGDAFEKLAQTRNMLFDFCANCNQSVFEKLIKTVGPKRILFGSDMPILRMRTRRICEDGFYVNLVPKGLYGDVSRDPHMREIEGEEAEKLTFFMYEEIDAFRRAAETTGLTRSDIEDVFYNNAMSIIKSARSGIAAKPAQLQMVWPVEQDIAVLNYNLPSEYEIRPFRPGDEQAYVSLMQKSGFETWGEAQVVSTVKQALPDGIFFVVHKATGKLVATACAQHSPAALHPAGGQLGWVASDPEHRGKRLSAAVCAESVKRHLSAGYKRIFLLTDDFRLSAIKTYIRQGWKPYLFEKGMKERWVDVLEKLEIGAAWLEDNAVE